MKIDELTNRELIKELLKRENERLDAFADIPFEHIEKIGKKYYVISIDNSAIQSTNIIQVRLEEYKTKTDIENREYRRLIGIFDSIDDAVIELHKELNNNAQR